MSQVVLGLRSLVIKLAIFVVMAALLAWALGGTLFPKPFVVEFIEDAVEHGDVSYFWRLTLDSRAKTAGEWQFVAKQGSSTKPIGKLKWNNAAAPVRAGSDLYFGCMDADGHWFIVRVFGPAQLGPPISMPDRLAVEQQLARLEAGLPLQDVAVILAQRAAVLDPKMTLVDEEGQPAGTGPAD